MNETVQDLVADLERRADNVLDGDPTAAVMYEVRALRLVATVISAQIAELLRVARTGEEKQ